MSKNTSQRIVSTSRSGGHACTLGDLLLERATRQPEFQAYTFLEDGEWESAALTYADLDRRAVGIAALLRENGVSEGRALLLYPAGLDFIAAFFGCVYAGVVAVPAYPPEPGRAGRTLPRLRAIAADAQPSAVLTLSTIFEAARPLIQQAPEFSPMRWVTTGTLEQSGLPESPQRKLREDDLACLQYTSGSTGIPKGVKLTHRNLLHNAAMVEAAFDHREDDVYVSWLPTFHDMGFMAGVLQPLYAGLRAIEMSPVAFLQKPSRWLNAISKYRATISGGPNFAFDLCVRR